MSVEKDSQRDSSYVCVRVCVCVRVWLCGWLVGECSLTAIREGILLWCKTQRKLHPENKVLQIKFHRFLKVFLQYCASSQCLMNQRG